MPTATTNQLAETIHQLKDATLEALAHPTLEDFNILERYANEVCGHIREVEQALWSKEARQAISNLEKNLPLSEADIDVIRTYVISDAKHYLEVENNYGCWLKELRRLADDISRRATNTDRHNIGELRGVIKDIKRLLPDICHYLDEQDRVTRFENAMSQLDPQSRELLARLMKDQLNNPNR